MISDIKPPRWWYKNKELQAKRRAIRKLLSNFETFGGILGNKAVVIVYDKKRPERTYIVTENI